MANLDSLLQKIRLEDTHEGSRARKELKLRVADVPKFFLEKYPGVKSWNVRCAMVCWAAAYSRENEAAYKLGLAALSDRSKNVRFEACALLAYSLRRESLPYLRQLQESARDETTLDGTRRAIDAIEHQNHHYFLDQEHTGRAFWHFATRSNPDETGEVSY